MRVVDVTEFSSHSFCSRTRNCLQDVTISGSTTILPTFKEAMNISDWSQIAWKNLANELIELFGTYFNSGWVSGQKVFSWFYKIICKLLYAFPNRLGWKLMLMEMVQKYLRMRLTLANEEALGDLCMSCSGEYHSNDNVA